MNIHNFFDCIVNKKDYLKIQQGFGSIRLISTIILLYIFSLLALQFKIKLLASPKVSWFFGRDHLDGLLTYIVDDIDR